MGEQQEQNEKTQIEQPNPEGVESLAEETDVIELPSSLTVRE